MNGFGVKEIFALFSVFWKMVFLKFEWMGLGCTFGVKPILFASKISINHLNFLSDRDWFNEIQ